MKERLSQWDHLPDKEIDAILFLDGSSKAKINHVLDNIKADEWDTVSKANLKRCEHLASLGRYSDAIQSLGSNGIHLVDQNILDQLQEKHPNYEKKLKMDFNSCPSIKLDEVFVKKSIKSFCKGSAGGPDGMRVEFLKKWSKGPTGELFLKTLVRFLDLIIQGKFCKKFAEYFSGATLIPLRKPDGGVRPIAVGNVMRRLACKCALKSVGDQVPSKLLPNQFGVCIQGGAESIIHSVNSVLQSLKNSEDYAVLQIDFKNAFNMVDRQHMFDVVAENFPELAKLVDFTYNCQGLLVCQDTNVLSCAGVQQGDPLGPLLFSLVLNKLILMIN